MPLRTYHEYVDSFPPVLKVCMCLHQEVVLHVGVCDSKVLVHTYKRQERYQRCHGLMIFGCLLKVLGSNNRSGYQQTLR